VFFFREEKSRVQRKQIANATKGIGKPKVGGPFSLIDQDGKPFSNEDMRDKYGLVSARICNTSLSLQLISYGSFISDILIAPIYAPMN
jgi:cytochrome oxidase Cu insertion factor (SCO1/SenC/PrrC family)